MPGVPAAGTLPSSAEGLLLKAGRAWACCCLSPKAPGKLQSPRSGGREAEGGLGGWPWLGGVCLPRSLRFAREAWLKPQAERRRARPKDPAWHAITVAPQNASGRSRAAVLGQRALLSFSFSFNKLRNHTSKPWASASRCVLPWYRGSVS